MKKTIHLLMPIFMIMCVLYSPHSYAQDRSTFAFIVNGHKYNMPEDLVARSIQDRFDVIIDSLDVAQNIQRLAQENNLTVKEISVPEDVFLQYQVDATGTHDFIIKITTESLRVLASGLGCDFNMEVSNLGFKITGFSDFDSGGFVIRLDEPEILEPNTSVRGSGGLLCPLLADALKGSIDGEVDQLLNELAALLQSVGFEELLAFINPIESLNIEDPELVSAALESFPMQMDMYTMEDVEQEIVQIVIAIDFLMGTTQDPAAFLGIEPDIVSGSQLQIGGFSFLYWVLQRGFPWHTEWDEFQRVDAAFAIMDELDLNGYRVETRWRSIQKRAYLGEDLDHRQRIEHRGIRGGQQRDLEGHLLGSAAQTHVDAPRGSRCLDRVAEEMAGQRRQAVRITRHRDRPLSAKVEPNRRLFVAAGREGARHELHQVASSPLVGLRIPHLL